MWQVARGTGGARGPGAVQTGGRSGRESRRREAVQAVGVPGELDDASVWLDMDEGRRTSALERIGKWSGDQKNTATVAVGNTQDDGSRGHPSTIAMVAADCRARYGSLSLNGGKAREVAA